MQQQLELIDELSSSIHYKREMKQRTENYYAYVCRYVEFSTDALTPEQTEQWVKISNEMRKILNQIQIQESTI
jgi:xanthine dehydrogenase molybdopterin-binding subunit B